jgi:hypothetical protein
MKHIKTYTKLFESSEDNQVKSYLKDIFIELEDTDIPVKIESTTGVLQSFLKYMKSPLLYTITIGTKSRRLSDVVKTFQLSDIYDSIQMAKSYMSEEGDVNKVFKGGYFLSDIKGGSPGKYGDVETYGLLYGFDLYQNGHVDKLFDKPLTYLELSFKRSN